MQIFLSAAQIIVSILLITVILFQNRGSGIGGALGGSSEVFYSRRGGEKFLFNAAVVLAVLFLALALIQIILI
jgi:protein translocase SecG subunit